MKEKFSRIFWREFLYEIERFYLVSFLQINRELCPLVNKMATHNLLHLLLMSRSQLTQIYDNGARTCMDRSFVHQ